MKGLVIGVDFDGTMVKHKYPEIGEPLEGAVETVLRLQEAGHKIILYTMRSHLCKAEDPVDRLQQAIDYMEENGIELYGVNQNPTQKYWTTSPKAFCHLFIDDASLGIPLEYEETGRPFVDWTEVEELLEERGFLDG